MLRKPSIATLLLAVMLNVGCHSSPRQEETSSPAAGTASGTPQGPLRDLSQDERHGGHTLQKHVGRSDQQLAERLERERNIAAASTYTDRETAEQAVGTALLENRDRINNWLMRPGGHANLVLDYEGEASSPIGRTMRRGEATSRPCSRAVVVLKWNAPGYYVLTSYPECR